MVGQKVDDALLVLDTAGDAEKGLGAKKHQVALGDAGKDDDVGEPRFVFEGHEEDARGGGRALAADDEAGVVRAVSVGDAVELFGRGKAQAIQ